MAGGGELKAAARFRLGRCIDRGGMGTVYEAEQQGAYGFTKKVAIKLLQPVTTGHADATRAFIGEARLVARLVHPNIAQVYNLGRTKNHIFIVMELVHGMNLQDLLALVARQGMRLPRDLAVYIINRALRGLAYAHGLKDDAGHALGLVHRDVHLRNILVSYEGDVKLTDFGIACARGFLPADNPDVIVGSPDFMSPEQISGEAIDHRSDIFSTGVVLSTLLLNVNPFAGASVEEMRQHLTQRALPDFRRMNPEIDEDLDRILRTALARQAAHRYASAYDMLSDVEHYLYAREHGPTADRLRRFLVEITTTPPKTRNITRTRTKVIPKPTAKTTAKAAPPIVVPAKKRG